MIGRTGNDGLFVWSLLWIPDTSFEEWQPFPSIPHAMITPPEGGAADWQEHWNKIIFKRNSNVYVFDTFERYDGVAPLKKSFARKSKCNLFLRFGCYDESVHARKI